MIIANRLIADVDTDLATTSRALSETPRLLPFSPPATPCEHARGDLTAIRALDEDISRAEAAYRLMLAADEYLREGADSMLEQLGFSAEHIAQLRRRAGPGGGYPPYSLRNIRATLHVLRTQRSQY